MSLNGKVTTIDFEENLGEYEKNFISIISLQNSFPLCLLHISVNLMVSVRAVDGLSLIHI